MKRIKENKHLNLGYTITAPDPYGKKLIANLDKDLKYLINRLSIYLLKTIKFILFYFKGITEENLDKLLSHALIPTEKKNVISNMQYLNLQIIQDQSRVSEKRNLFVYYI